MEQSKAQYSEPLAYGVKDACRIVGIGKTKAFELLSDGRLERVKVGRRTLITAASLKLLAECGAA